MKRKPKPNRTALIRAFLVRNRSKTFTAREVATAIEPKGDVDVFNATLANLARTGEVLKISGGYGNTRFSALREANAPVQRKPRGRAKPVAPPTVEVPRTFAGAKQSAAMRKIMRAKPLAETIGGIARPARPGRRRDAASNFTAAPGTVDHAFCPQRQASARIAADIAAFEARGGAIERLGPTQFFHVDTADNDAD